MRTWYCAECSTTIARDELNGETCRKCGGTKFVLQPVPHSEKATTVSPFDRRFLNDLKILPPDIDDAERESND